MNWTDQNTYDLGPADKRAADGIRTHDLVLTKDALCQLSYSSQFGLWSSHGDDRCHTRRSLAADNPQLLYKPPENDPAKQILLLIYSPNPAKAGEGSRTLVNSLEGYGSTVELHPRLQMTNFLMTNDEVNLRSSFVIRASYSYSSQVGGAGFEPAKALPSDLQSDPFDRSGNPPFCLSLDLGCFQPGLVHVGRPTCMRNEISLQQNEGLPLRASGGTRTHNLLITNQLLCQLSYASRSIPPREPLNISKRPRYARRMGLKICRTPNVSRKITVTPP